MAIVNRRSVLLGTVCSAVLTKWLTKPAEAFLTHFGQPSIATVPFIQEVTMSAPDIVRFEIRDPLIQRGLCQFLGSSFSGTDQTWTTSTNPLPSPATNNCMPLGNSGYLLTLRFDDIIPTNWYNRLAGDVAANWIVGGPGGITVTAVYRKSYPYCEGNPHFVNGNESTGLFPQTASRHYIELQLSSALVSGDTYVFVPPSGTDLPSYTLNFNDTQTRANSIQANQAGHRAVDDEKLAILTKWLAGGPNEGQINFASTYGISSFNIIDKNGNVAYSGGTFGQRVTPTTVEAGDNNSGNLRFYRSAEQAPIPITSFTYANPGVFTTSNSSAPANGTVVLMQGFGAGIQLTNMAWSGGQVTFTGPNSQSGVGYVAGQYFTISQASPAGYNGTFLALAGTSSTQLVAALASNPGAKVTNGILSGPNGAVISIPANATSSINGSGNTSGFFVTANASGKTFNLQQMALPSGAAGSNINTTSWGLWGQGTYLTAALAQILGADDNFGNGYDSFFQPCYQANRAGTYVYGLDYSAATITNLPASGAPYRVQISGLGVSDPIQIADYSWYNIAWNWMKAMYHQTEGPAIDGRFGFYRPAALQDGVNGNKWFKSLLPMGFCAEGTPYTNGTTLTQGLIALAPFIQSGRGPSGYAPPFDDAGDWTSLLYAHASQFWNMLDTGYEYVGGGSPSFTTPLAAGRSTTFNFPKASTIYGSMYSSIDGMPDIIHCAVYFAEYYRLTQDAYGATASGSSFGSLGFGDGGASELIPSSATSYALGLGAPDHVSSYAFATLAGKLAIQFYNYFGSETTLVTTWVNAAVAAFDWADGIYVGLQSDPQFYYGSTTYNGIALNIPANTVTAAIANCAATSPYAPISAAAPWSFSPTGTTVNGVAPGNISNGAPGSCTPITTSSDFTNGTYRNIPLTGGSGTGAYATFMVIGGKVVNVFIERPGNNYAVSDVLSCNLASIGGGSSFSVTVSSSTSQTHLQQTSTFDNAVGIVGQASTPIGTITGGSGGIAGTYTGVPFIYVTSGTGSGAVGSITVGVGGNVTAVSITSPGVNYLYNDVLTVAPSPGTYGTITGFSFPLHYVTPTKVNGETLGYYAWENRASAAAQLFRLMGILSDPSQSSYGTIFMSGGLGLAGTTANFWEIYWSANNTSELAFINSVNYPTNWTVAAQNTCTASENSTNSYYTNSGGLTTGTQYYDLVYGYIIRAAAAGTSDATCIRIRKALQAQLGFTLGANPSGLCFPCGIGARNTLGILHRNWQAVTRLYNGFQPPPAGITPYGFEGTLNPTGIFNFGTDNQSNWTVTNPTGVWESTNGTKRIVTPNNDCLPMTEGTVENSYCIQIMEYSFSGVPSDLIPAIWLWCWDGNSTKS